MSEIVSEVILNRITVKSINQLIMITMRYIFKIFLFCVFLAVCTQTRMLGWEASIRMADVDRAVNKNESFYIECKEVDDIEQNYVCVPKKYEWVLEYIDADFEKDINGIEVKLEGKDQIIQKIRAVKDDLFLIQASIIEHEKINISYMGLQEDTLGNLKFKTVSIPEQFKAVETELPNIVHEQVDKQFAHKRSHLLVQALIILVILLVIVGLVYYWRRSTLTSKIDVEPTDLKEAMMAKMEIQKQENRKQSAGIVRASEPPPKSKISGA